MWDILIRPFSEVQAYQLLGMMSSVTLEPKKTSDMTL